MDELQNAVSKLQAMWIEAVPHLTKAFDDVHGEVRGDEVVLVETFEVSGYNFH